MMKATAFWTGYALALALLGGLVAHTSDPHGTCGRYSPIHLSAIIGTLVLCVAWKAIFAWLAKPSVIPRRERPPMILRPTAKVVLAGLATGLLLAAGEARARRNARVAQTAQLARLAAEEPTYDPYLQIRQTAIEPGDAVNPDGFKGDPVPASGPRVVKIFLLGGSSMLCDDVAYTDSHPYLLQRMLARHFTNATITVQNAGMYWHTSLHSLVKYVATIRRHDPDIVIVMHAINDLYRSFSPPSWARPNAAFQPDYSHFYGPVEPMVAAYFRPAGHTPPLIHSELLIHLAGALYSDFRRRDDGPLRSPRPAEEMKAIAWPEFASLPSFRGHMESLVSAIMSDGVAALILTEPFLYAEDLDRDEQQSIWMNRAFCTDGTRYVDVASMATGMRDYNNASLEVARRHGASAFDLAGQIPKRSAYFVDDCHYTPAGNALVASNICEFILSRGLIEERLATRAR